MTKLNPTSRYTKRWKRLKTQARRIQSDTFQSLLLTRAKRLNRSLVRLNRLVSEKMAECEALGLFQ